MNVSIPCIILDMPDYQLYEFQIIVITATAQWNLSKMVTELGSHFLKQSATLAPSSTKALQSMHMY